MFLSGIADEAGKTLESQIAAHKTLGWNHIDLRKIDGVEFTDCSDAEFNAICDALNAADLQLACVASPIGAGRTHISDDFAIEVERLKRAITRMNALGCSLIRVMTWPGKGVDQETWGNEAVRRMNELAKLAEDAGITLLVENCGGWSSQSTEHLTQFFDRVQSPFVKVVYDTGNPASHGADNTWKWYQAAKPHLGYVHIKCHTGPVEDKEKRGHCWPGEGASLVKETLSDLLANGYDGGIAIEPHLWARLRPTPETTDEESSWLTYVEYGRRLMKLVEAAGFNMDPYKTKGS